MPETVDLRFITDDILREMILRDVAELELCVKYDLHKSALILSGSIIEAILVDYFLAFPPSNGKSPNDIKNASLANLIDWASDINVKLISDTSKTFTTIIREYRNLIHPGVEYRKQISPDKNKANISKSLVMMIIEEIRTNYIDRLGYTCEQAIKKVYNDKNSKTLFDHIISNMSGVEKIKLYKKIPTLELDGSALETDHIENLKNFRILHTSIRPDIPIDVRTSEVFKLYEYISEGSSADIIRYALYYLSDIDLLEPKKKDIVINYFLDLLKNEKIDNLQKLDSIGMFSELGRSLNNDDGIKKITDIIINRLFYETDEKDEFLSVILSLLTHIDYDRIHPMIEKLQTYYYEPVREAGDWLSENIIPF